MTAISNQSNQQYIGEVVRKHRDKISLTLAALLLFSIIGRHTAVSSTIALSLISVVYLLTVTLLLFDTDIEIRAERIYLLLFLMLTIFMLASMLYNITQESVIRFIVFAVFTSANLFILPQIIDFEDFVVVFGRVTALLVVIGFLPYLGLPTAAGPFDLTLWGGKLYWYPALQPITSIFVAVNWLGFLTLSGSIFALGEWWMFKSNVSKVILGVNTLGLLFTNYRAGWVGFLVAVGILFIYVLFDREGVKLAILGGIIATIVALAMMFEIIPGPAVLSELSLNHRRGSWIAAAQILQEQPFLGYGFGNTAAVLSGVVPPGSPANVHNSYIRAFLALGLGGGLTYLGLFLATLLKGASRVTTKSDMILLMGLLSYLVVQLFNSLSFIGLSLHSVIIAIMMGYQVME